MKGTTSDLRLMSVLDLQNHLIRHQQRLATIYSSSKTKTSHRRRRRQMELNRLQKNKQMDRQMRSHKTLEKIGYENSIIHGKLIEERGRRIRSPHSIGLQMKLDLSAGRKKQKERIQSQNLKIVHKLVTARPDILPHKLKQHQQQHVEIMDRLSKAKRREQIKHLLVSKYNIDQPGELPYYFPELKVPGSKSRVRSVSSTKPF